MLEQNFGLASRGRFRRENNLLQNIKTRHTRTENNLQIIRKLSVIWSGSEVLNAIWESSRGGKGCNSIEIPGQGDFSGEISQKKRECPSPDDECFIAYMFSQDCPWDKKDEINSKDGRSVEPHGFGYFALAHSGACKHQACQLLTQQRGGGGGG